MRHRLSYASVTATLALFIAIRRHDGRRSPGAPDRPLRQGRVADRGGHPERFAHGRRHPHGHARLEPLQPRRARQSEGRNRPGRAGRSARRDRPERPGRRGRDRCRDHRRRRPRSTRRWYPLANITLPRAGDYVVFARLTAHNTGVGDDYLNCALFIGDNASVGGGVGRDGRLDRHGQHVGAISVTAPQEVVLKCQGGTAPPTTSPIS